MCPILDDPISDSGDHECPECVDVLGSEHNHACCGRKLDDPALGDLYRILRVQDK